eukprot:Pgem_evm1s1385
MKRTILFNDLEKGEAKIRKKRKKKPKAPGRTPEAPRRHPESENPESGNTYRYLVSPICRLLNRKAISRITQCSFARPNLFNIITYATALSSVSRV